MFDSAQKARVALQALGYLDEADARERFLCPRNSKSDSPESMLVDFDARRKVTQAATDALMAALRSDDRIRIQPCAMNLLVVGDGWRDTGETVSGGQIVTDADMAGYDGTNWWEIALVPWAICRVTSTDGDVAFFARAG